MVAPASLLSKEEEEKERERQAARRRKERQHPPTPVELAKAVALQGIIHLLLPAAFAQAEHRLARGQDNRAAKASLAELGGAPRELCPPVCCECSLATAPAAPPA